MTSRIEVTDLTEDVPHTLVAAVWVGPFLSVRVKAGDVESDAQGPGGWRIVRLTFTPTTTTATVTLTRVSGEGTAHMDLLTAVEGHYNGHPFDGNTPPNGRTNYGWVDDENNSESIAQETPVTLTLVDDMAYVKGQLQNNGGSTVKDSAQKSERILVDLKESFARVEVTAEEAKSTAVATQRLLIEHITKSTT